MFRQLSIVFPLAHHRQRLRQVSRTPAVTLNAQISVKDYDLLAQSNYLTLPKPANS